MTTNSEPTVTEHLAASEAIVAQLKNADALVIKLRNQLVEARAVIDNLGEAAHPLLNVDVPYSLRYAADGRDVTVLKGPVLAKKESDRISAALGDRA